MNGSVSAECRWGNFVLGLKPNIAMLRFGHVAHGASGRTGLQGEMTQIRGPWSVPKPSVKGVAQHRFGTIPEKKDQDWMTMSNYMLTVMCPSTFKKTHSIRAATIFSLVAIIYLWVGDGWSKKPLLRTLRREIRDAGILYEDIASCLWAIFIRGTVSGNILISLTFRVFRQGLCCFASQLQCGR